MVRVFVRTVQFGHADFDVILGRRLLREALGRGPPAPVPRASHTRSDVPRVRTQQERAGRPTDTGLAHAAGPFRWNFVSTRQGLVETNAPVGVDTCRMSARDEDLERLSREALVQEVLRLREGIRRHRDSTGHELCWHHPLLWGLLPESTDPIPEVPDWPEFLRGCIRYRQSLDDQLATAPRTTENYDLE